MLLRQNVKRKRATKILGSLAQYILRERPKMGEITAREYVMLLRIILFMDEIVERGLSIICKSFSDVGGKGNQTELKQLFNEILEKTESIKMYKELYANVFLLYCKRFRKRIYLKRKSFK